MVGAPSPPRSTASAVDLALGSAPSQAAGERGVAMRRFLTLVAAAGAAAVLGLSGAGAAWACGGLVAPNGTVRLLRTSTLAAWHAGVEHYVTSFQFSGQGSEFGSIVPLPAIPSAVVRGGDWTLQRLEREVAPPVPRGAAVSAAAGA